MAQNIEMIASCSQITALVLSIAGGCCDIRAKKIPNCLTIPAMVAGMAYWFICGGLTGFCFSFGGLTAGFAVILLWLIGGLKAGDVKLYMAIGSWGGAAFLKNTFIASVLLGGVTALIFSILHGILVSSLKRLRDWFFCLVFLHTFNPYQPADPYSYFPFGACIAGGTAVALLYNTIF